MKYLFNHAHLIIDGNKEYIDGALLIEDEHIIETYPNANKVDVDTSEYKIIDCSGCVIMPGFFDTHLHGIKNISFDTANKEELDKATLELAKSGTTSFIPSLSYDCDNADFDARFKLFENYEGEYCRFEGFHLEGPFISDKHLGIAHPDKIKKPDINLVKDILSKTDKLRQMTIAYELDGAKEIGKLLKENGVKVMCGHSDACLGDLDENVDGFTHLFNAMRGLHHRDITLINCAFMNKWNVELIADGNHVERNVLKLVLNNIDRDKIMLVSDSSTARGLEDGEHIFLSNRCFKNGTVFKTDTGHFAGSVVSINDEIKVLKELGAKYTDLLMYSSLNIFKFYNLDQKYGSLIKGKSSDIVIMDEDLNIKKVLVKGKLIEI